ncbi:hypothetical protein pb186bvf_000331 [Paramecium bursaria]
MGCSGSNKKKQEEIIQNYQNKLIINKQTIDKFTQQKEDILKEYNQHKMTYPQLVLEKFEQMQTLQQQKEYLLDLQKRKQIEYNNHIIGIKNLERIMNKQLSIAIQPIQIKEYQELDKISDQTKREAIRKKVTDLNSIIQRLQNEHKLLTNDISNRQQQDQQNKLKYDEFTKKLLKQIEEINKNIESQNVKYKEIIGKLETTKLEIKNQQVNIENDKSQINLNSNFESYINSQENRKKEQEQFIKAQRDLIQKNNQKLDIINKEIIKISNNIPIDISDLQQGVHKQNQQLQEIVQQKEKEFQEKVPGHFDPNDPIQEEIFKLFDLKNQFDSIDQAFKKLEKEVFKKLSDEMDEIARLNSNFYFHIIFYIFLTIIFLFLFQNFILNFPQMIVGAIKIKDGLFIGDEFASQDLEFVVSNKVTHIINCCSKQLPNVFENFGVKYLKFNWSETDQQVLFEQNTANEIFQFIEEAHSQGESCLVHSVRGLQRSCCALAAYFMRKYKWKLYKTLEFLNSRRPDLEIRASFYHQMTQLEIKLQKRGEGAVSSSWDPNQESEMPLDTDEKLMRNTFMNSKQSPPADCWLDRRLFLQFLNEKRTKSITWADQTDACRKSQKRPKSGKPILKQMAEQISNINGNVFHVTVNNYLTPQEKQMFKKRQQNDSLKRHLEQKNSPYQKNAKSVKSQKKEPSLDERPKSAYVYDSQNQQQKPLGQMRQFSPIVKGASIPPKIIPTAKNRGWRYPSPGQQKTDDFAQFINKPTWK